MKDQKNKQSQPEQSKDTQQSRDKSQGDMGSSDQGMKKGQGNMQEKNKPNMSDAKWEQPVGSDIENPDKENDPEKKIKIDDDPEQTKKKVPNIGE
ncbi:MAG TPA: hypothetical protein VG605_18595 [Puia sp.]|nr:hypothetical protein [Puia sp.]